MEEEEIERPSVITIDPEQALLDQKEVLTRLGRIEDLLQFIVHRETQPTISSSSSTSGSFYVPSPHQTPTRPRVQGVHDSLDASSLSASSVDLIGTGCKSDQFNVQLTPPTAPPTDKLSPTEVSETATAQSDAADIKPDILGADNFAQKLGLSPNLVRIVNQEANSRQNFAAKLVKKVYSKKEREMGNVHGRRGKKRLDPERMDLVKRLTYHLRPVKPGESEDENWKKTCVIAIDTANRRDKDQ